MQFLTMAFTASMLGTCTRENEVSNFRINLRAERQPGESRSKQRDLLHLD